MASSREERVAGGIYGLLVGDALGVPYEFHDPRQIPPTEGIEFTPPPEVDGKPFRRAHGEVPPGTWSDDGAQALCLLDSLLHCGGLDLEDLGRRLRNWWDNGYLAVDRPFDIGNTTSSALAALEHGVPAERAGPATEADNGNGGLMRVLPLALWHRGPDADLVQLALRQTRVTHGHPRSGICSAIFCVYARRLLNGRADEWDDAVATVRACGVDPQELEVVTSFASPRGTGYVVDTLHTARAALDAGPYEQVVKRAIAFGHDTDTTASIAGGLAGVRDGVGAIPRRWLDALRGRELVEPLVARLLAVAG